MKSQCSGFSTSTTPHGYIRPRTLRPLTSMIWFDPTTANGIAVYERSETQSRLLRLKVSTSWKMRKPIDKRNSKQKKKQPSLKISILEISSYYQRSLFTASFRIRYHACNLFSSTVTLPTISFRTFTDQSVRFFHCTHLERVTLLFEFFIFIIIAVWKCVDIDTISSDLF